MLNPLWLRSFVEIHEQGGFTLAADRLGLTQAAVSQHMRQLEQRLGPLLLRRGRQQQLTPAGQALLAYARELQQADKRLEARLADGGITQGEISVITPGSVGLMLYPRLLALQEAAPGLVIRHRFAPDPEVLEAVLQSRYELGITTVRPDDPRVAARPFASEPLELVVPSGARAGEWEDLRRLGFIDHPDGQAMAARLLSRRFPADYSPRALPVHGFTNQVALILEPVSRGLGFTVLPRYARQAFARQDRIAVVEGEPPVVDTLWLIHRAEWPLSARATHAVEALRRGLVEN
ncbi:LysR family transcriptional regulator [Stenotrophomonas panacihumi]|uniref:LysR family transcriptional regulator n=1 Tax=Stenotrophomonas panacihumi TaxID=676599 RepID=A0A0R0AE97_9GAMM|nr:LysR family transcriptional regulator [Stenotrophomonas panacihumi]KRG43260.1 LysR family transcriptional regulator [Stenotrophomonas panacihumi]PTN55689.1 LysR family transcriptional regulator [Stenotrophomonas panacihumi]